MSHPDELAEAQIKLLASMRIQREGNWFTGTIAGYPFQVKVTVEGSAWGIDNGRIIKLFVTEKPEGSSSKYLNELISYERGWGIYPEPGELEDIVDAFVEYFANDLDKEVR